MVTASIIINQSGKSSGLPSTSRDDLDIGSSVILSNNNNSGVTSWFWELISKPPNSTAILGSPTSPSTLFTPDIVGSYLIKLTVSDGITDSSDRRIAAVKTPFLDIRIPATEEKTEFDSSFGWSKALHKAIVSIDNYSLLSLKKDGSNTPTQNIAWGNYKITNLSNPNNPQDAATKDYVDTRTHSIGGSTHTTSTLAELNTKISNAILDDYRSSRPPSGNASGDLTGTYPNPTVSKIKGLDVVGTPNDNQLMIYKTSSGNIEWITANFDSYNLKISQNDTTPSFVEDKFTAGSNVQLSTLNDGSNESFKISVNLDAYSPSLDTSYNGGRIITADSGEIVINASGNNALDLEGYLTLGEITEPTQIENKGLIYVKDDFGNTELFYRDNYGNTIQITKDGNLNTDADSYQVKISQNDTTPNYIESKFIAGSNVQLSTLNDGSNESFKINVNLDAYSPSLDTSYNGERTITVDSGPVVLNASGSNALNLEGYLTLGEITEPIQVADKGLLYVKDDFGDTELFYRDNIGNTIQITKDGNLNTDADSYKVKISQNDTTPNYIENKFTAGSNVQFSTLNDGSNESFKVSVNLDAYSPSLDTSYNGGRTIIIDSGPIVLNASGSNALNLEGYLTLGEITEPTQIADKGILYVKDDSGDSELFYRDNYGNTIQITKDGNLNTDADSYKVKISQNDTTPNYIESKFIAGSNVQLSTLNDGSNESFQINVNLDSYSPSLDISYDGGRTITVDVGPVVLNASGSNALNLEGYLTLGEITEPTQIANKGLLYVKDDFGDTELFYRDNIGNTIQITKDGNLNTDADSYKVKISQNDTTPNYIENKFTAGSNVQFSTLNDGSNESFKVSVNLDAYSPSLDTSYNGGRTIIIDSGPIVLNASGSNALNLEGYLTLGEITEPTQIADKGILYVKDDSGDSELFYRDNYGNTIQITKDGNLNTDADSYKVKISQNDTTPNYIESKFIAGSNVQLSTLNDGSNESFQINVNLDSYSPSLDISYDGGRTITVDVGPVVLNASGSNALNLEGYLTLGEITEPTQIANKGLLYVKDDSGDSELFYRDNIGNTIQITKDGSLNAVATPGSDSYQVKISQNDTTPNYIESKFTAGSNVQLSTLNDGSNENFQINVNLDAYSPSLDISYDGGRTITVDVGPVVLNASGSNALNLEGYLTLGEITEPTQIADKGLLYVKDDSGDSELFYRDNIGNTIQITKDGSLNVAATPGSDSYQVKISQNDTTPNYIESKFTAGSNVQLSTLNDGSNESFKINVNLDAYSPSLNTSYNGGRTITVDSGPVVLNASGSNALNIDGYLTLGEIIEPTQIADKGLLYVKDDSGDSELFYRDNIGNIVQITKDGSLNAVVGGGSDSYQVKISSNDTTPSYIENKFTAGSNVQLSTLNDGSNESLKINVNLDSYSPSLDTSYNGGRTITVDSGPVVLNASGSNALNLEGYLTLGEITEPTQIADKGLLYVKDDSGDSELFYRDNIGNTIQITKDGSLNAAVGGGSDSYQVKISSNDTTPNYIESKFTAGSNVQLSTLNDGSNESFQVSVNLDAYSPSLDTSYNGGRVITVDAGPVVLSASGSNALDLEGYLTLGEITEPTQIADKGLLYVKDDSGDSELFYRDNIGNTIQITKDGSLNAVVGGGSDSYQVKVSSNDTTPNYIENKFTAGSNVQLSTLNDGSNESFKISVNLDAYSPSLDTSYNGGRTITVDSGPVVLNASGSNALNLEGYLTLGEITEPTQIADKGLLYVKDDSGDSELFYRDNIGNTIQITKDGSLNAAVGGGSDSYQVKISSNDTTPNYIESKFTAGSNVQLSTLNDGSNESFQVSVNLDAYSPSLDTSYNGGRVITVDAGPVVLSASGSNALDLEGYLTLGEITEPTQIADKGLLYVKDDSGDSELFYRDNIGNTIQITKDGSLNAVVGGGSDSYQVKVSSNDTTPNYIENKFTAGSNVQLSTLNDGSNESLKINVNLDAYSPSLDTSYNGGRTITVDSGPVLLNASGSNALNIDGYLTLGEITEPTQIADKGLLYVKDDSGDSELFYRDNIGNTIQITKDGSLNAAVGGGSDSYQVKISSNDTTPNYIESKFTAGSNVQLSTLNDGSNESFQVSVNLDAYSPSLDTSYNGGRTIIVDSGPVVLNASGSNALNIDGYISIKELSSVPANVDNYGMLFTKDISGTTALFYKDSYGVLSRMDGYSLINTNGILLASATKSGDQNITNTTSTELITGLTLNFTTTANEFVEIDWSIETFINTTSHAYVRCVTYRIDGGAWVFSSPSYTGPYYQGFTGSTVLSFSAGSHTVEFGFRTGYATLIYGGGTILFEFYPVCYSHAKQFRGGLVPWQQNGTLINNKPTAINIIGGTVTDDGYGKLDVNISDSYQVKISSNDTTPNYIESKFTAGSNVQLFTLNDGSNKSLKINVNPDAYSPSLDTSYNGGRTITVDSGPVVFNASGNNALNIDGYVSIKEISSVPTNIDNYGMLFTKDISGTTALFYKDSYGVLSRMDGYSLSIFTVYEEEFTASIGSNEFTLNTTPTININTLSGRNIIGVYRDGIRSRYKLSLISSNEYNQSGGSNKINVISQSGGEIFTVVYGV